MNLSDCNIDDFSDDFYNLKLSILCEEQICSKFDDGTIEETYFLKFLALIELASLELRTANYYRRRK
jgi:hypothetical protein